MDAAQAEIHAYEAPWKALCDFALHSDLDKMNMAGNPHYGQLVSQVRGRAEKQSVVQGARFSTGKRDDLVSSNQVKPLHNFHLQCFIQILH